MDEITKGLEEALNKNYRLRMPGNSNEWCYAGSFTIGDKVYAYVSESLRNKLCIVTTRCVKHSNRHNSYANHDFYIKRNGDKILITPH